MFEGIKLPRFLCECKFGKAKGKTNLERWELKELRKTP
jgi:hypothetical protein